MRQIRASQAIASRMLRAVSQFQAWFTDGPMPQDEARLIEDIMACFPAPDPVDMEDEIDVVF